MIHQKRGGALRGLRINREILILRKPPIEVVVLLTHVKNVKNVKHVKHVTFVVATLFILVLVVQIVHTN